MRALSFLAAGVLAIGATASAAAEPKAPVSGQLTVAGATILPTDAVAVWSTAEGARQLQVILAPGAIATTGSERALEPYQAIRDRITGDSVTVTLSAAGELEMVYAFVAERSGNYGFGTGGTAAVEIAGGRVAGRVFTAGEERIGDTPIAFDLRFDLEILAERAPGALIAAGGGEPGAAYLALVAAQRTGDLEVLARHLRADQAEGLAETPESFRSWLLDSYKEMAHQEVTVTGGELFDGWAILAVAGKDYAGHALQGRVRMDHDGTSWRLAEESLVASW